MSIQSCRRATQCLALPLLLLLTAVTLGPPAFAATDLTAAVSANVPTYPDDAYSRPPADRWHCFETTCGILLGGSTLDRPAQWHRNELLSVEVSGARQTQWQFRRKQGVSVAASVGFTENIRRAPESISFHVTNNSAKPLSFHAIMYEQSWHKAEENGKQYLEWAIPASKAVAPGAEQDVILSLAGMTSTQASERKKPWFPARLTIVADGVEDETDYSLLLSKLELHYANAPGVVVSRISAPRKARVSSKVTISVEANGVAEGAVVDLELRDNALVLWRVRLTADETRKLTQSGKVSLTRALPWFLRDCEMTLGLVVNGYRASGAEAKINVVNGKMPALVKAERRDYHGRPTFFVNGKPLTWSGYASYDYQPGNVGDFGASGADMFVVPTDAGRHVHQVAAPTWRDRDAYDFGELDERVAMGLQANPDSFITLRVSLALPPFWFQEHRDSAALIRTAQGDSTWEETGSVAVSLASAAWREQQTACLRKLLEHCKAQPWAGRVAAVILGGEVTEEWFMWGCNDGQYADYSADNARDFNAWRRAHGFPDTAIPSPKERNLAGYDTFPPDAAGRDSATYAQYSSDKTAETIEYFAKIVKEETQGRSLVGVFYGYVVQLAGEPRQSLSGHFALRRLLDSSDIDYILGIPLHNFRRYADGYDLYTSATESILAHGKGYANENDLFSWLHNGPWYTEYNPADPRAGAIRMHQRVLGDDMVHGVSRQWFSLLASWHHDAGLQREFAREIALNRKASGYDRSPAEEIAFVVDDTSFAWMPPASSLSRTTNADLLYSLGRTGAPVGVWLLSDLDRLPDRIRMVVVASATAAKPADLEKLRALIKRGERTVVVVGPAGLANPDTLEWNRTATAELTGMPIAVDDNAGPGIAKLIADGKEVSHVATLRPRASVSGDGWMTYADGKTAGSERALDKGGRLIWCGVPPLDSGLLRGWIEGAGVHCYAPVGFTVHASKQLVSVTASTTGETQLLWPRSTAVKDLLDGWTGKGQAMVCPFETGQTRLFALTSR